MTRPRVLVLRAPGINCDEETAFAWQQAGANPECVHVKRLIDSPSLLDGFQVLTVPGGFSYGDDIASGRLLGNQLRHGLGDALTKFVDGGGLVLGICNGFQVLVRLGLLPGADAPAEATLTWNLTGRYEARWVLVRAETDRCAFLRPGELYRMPTAHAEGRIATAGGATGAGRLAESGHIALRYVTADGAPARFPDNPNGSVENTAGLTDSTGNVLGLMPHPERNLFPCHSRDATVDNSPEIGGCPVHAGTRLFDNAVAHFN